MLLSFDYKLNYFKCNTHETEHYKKKMTTQKFVQSLLIFTQNHCLLESTISMNYQISHGTEKVPETPAPRRKTNKGKYWKLMDPSFYSCCQVLSWRDACWDFTLSA